VNRIHIIRTVLMLMVSAIGSSLCPAPLFAQAGLAQRISLPSVPPSLEVPPGNQVFLKAFAGGTQNYICMPSGWTFTGPQATLFVTFPWVNGPIWQQIATHFLSPNVAEEGTLRPVWQSSLDTSLTMAKSIASSSDPAYVAASAIPWLLLQAVGSQAGPTGGSAFSQTTFIQRVNTSGGMMPEGWCSVGERAFVPYTADYVFYRTSGS
jgi:hypothetical protein